MAQSFGEAEARYHLHRMLVRRVNGIIGRTCELVSPEHTALGDV